MGISLKSSEIRTAPGSAGASRVRLSDVGGVLYHFSEDPSIERFVPHVPATNPDHPPAVWAIDAEHAPLYWFPRDCPRVAAWARGADERAAFEAAFVTTSRRVHAIELGWLERVRTVELFRYALPADTFSPWTDANGQWISRAVVEPVAVERVGEAICP